MAKKGRKGAKKQLTKEELIKIKELLDQEIKEVFGTEANFIEQDAGMLGMMGNQGNDEDMNNFRSNDFMVKDTSRNLNDPQALITDRSYRKETQIEE